MQIILAPLFIVCTNPPDANGNLAPDCVTATCQKRGTDSLDALISDYLKQGKKLAKPDKIDLGKAIIFRNNNCKGKG